MGVGRSGEGVEGTDARFVDALAEACGDGGLSGGLGRCRRVGGGQDLRGVMDGSNET